MLKPSAVVELVWQDETGSNAMTTLYASSGSTVAEIDDLATAISSILASLTDAVLVKQRIKYISVPEAPVAAGGSTPVTRNGIFFFSTGSSTPDALLAIPGIKDSVLVTSGPLEGVGIDLTNSDVIAFRDAVLSLPFSNPFGDEFTSLFAAYLQSRV